MRKLWIHDHVSVSSEHGELLISGMVAAINGNTVTVRTREGCIAVHRSQVSKIYRRTFDTQLAHQQ